ncbi:MAG: hypothetical protein AAFP92_12015, partial [Bacteroidota bacterium]
SAYPLFLDKKWSKNQENPNQGLPTSHPPHGFSVQRALLESWVFSKYPLALFLLDEKANWSEGLFSGVRMLQN